MARATSSYRLVSVPTRDGQPALTVKRCWHCRADNDRHNRICRSCGRQLVKPPRRAPASLTAQLRDAERRQAEWQRRLSRATTGLRETLALVSRLRTQVAVEHAVQAERQRAASVAVAGRAIRLTDKPGGQS